MRIVLIAAPVLALALSACASSTGSSRYETELNQLADDCRARGGILAPTGQTSGRPQTDNVCKITGPAGRTGRD